MKTYLHSRSIRCYLQSHQGRQSIVVSSRRLDKFVNVERVHQRRAQFYKTIIFCPNTFSSEPEIPFTEILFNEGLNDHLNTLVRI